jgi:hypothetical protein
MSLINTANFVVNDHGQLYLVRQYRKHGADNLTTNGAYVAGNLPHELNGTTGQWDGDYFTVELVTEDSITQKGVGQLYLLPCRREAEELYVLQCRSNYDHLTVIDSRDVEAA